MATTNEITDEVLSTLVNAEKQAKEALLEEITRVEGKLADARRNIEHGQGSRIHDGIIGSSRLDIAAAKFAEAHHTLAHIDSVINVLPEFRSGAKG